LNRSSISRIASSSALVISFLLIAVVVQNAEKASAGPFARIAERHRRARRLALPRSSTYTTITKPFCAHFAQFLSSLAFDKKTSALRRSFLVPTFVYRHRFISLLVIRMPVAT
jgi:hypothetical protein